jgi:uncharacterized protein (DUF1330 family)
LPAYVIVDIEVTDPEGYQEYIQATPETLKPYQGRYVVRGGKNETLEGEWHAKRLVILEFPTADLAKAWLNSPHYAPVRALRHKYAKSNMVLVEGAAP